MITAKTEQELIDRIKTLTELEFSALLTEMAAHLRKNNWEHIIDECFDIETYEEELDSANEEVLHWKDLYRTEEAKIQKIRDIV